uniref:Putative secreted protein n=1 Tax=Anopheles darlingi TaxID=43151 RepID=A0A2M4DL08_ANODA
MFSMLKAAPALSSLACCPSCGIWYGSKPISLIKRLSPDHAKPVNRSTCWSSRRFRVYGALHKSMLVSS